MRYLIKITTDVKKILYSTLLLVIILIATKNNAFAESCEKCSIHTSFTGMYSEETCEIVINDKGSTDTITLPTVSAQSLSQGGTEAGSVRFSVGLKNCPTDRVVKLKFVDDIYQSDESTGNLINKIGEEYSKNIQIRLRKEDESQIKVNDLSSAQTYTISESGDIVTHEYYASYFAKAQASSGIVSAMAGIEIFYK